MDPRALTPPATQLKPVDKKPSLGLLDLPNELLLQIFHDVASYTLQPRCAQTSPVSATRGPQAEAESGSDEEESEDDEGSEVENLEMDTALDMQIDESSADDADDEYDEGDLDPADDFDSEDENSTSANGGPPQANNALSVYHMRLMSLARENQKHWLVARQENDKLRGVLVSESLLKALRTFLGYGLNKQLLPIVRDTLFSDIRPPIIRCLHMPGGIQRHESWFPYFGEYFDTVSPGRQSLYLEKLERSGWTRNMKYLRIDTAMEYMNISAQNDKEYYQDIEEAMDKAISIATNFRALRGLEIKVETDYGHSLSLYEAGRREAVLAAEIKRKLEEKDPELKVEVTVTFWNSDVGFTEW